VTKQDIADALADKARELAFENQLAAADVPHINALASTLAGRFPATATPPAPPAPAQPPSADLLTLRSACELVDHEAIVLEWYLDSVKVGTWGIGVTNKSGHNVDRYKDSPQTIEHVLDIYVWLLRNNYIPAGVKAFAGHTLTEAQFTAALSFHYNTGAILDTTWVALWRDGKPKAARAFLTSHYLNGGDLQDRRDAEAALFFDGVWSTENGTAVVWPVKKPSYTPDWAHPQRVDIRNDMTKALAA